MKNQAQFGDNSKINNVGESYSFNKEENNPRLNENFVYRFEENKSGGASNNTGQEYNHISHIHKTHTSKIDQNSLNSTATSTTATVSTVATVATTAVIVVVGGSLVVFGQNVEKPSICQFDELYAVDNTIRYSLALGNNIERINSGEEKDECDIVIELTCESYNDFKEVKEIKNYGRIDSEFTDLDYSTEYTLNVYQNAFLDLEKEAIIEPIKITTEGNVIPPEPTGNFAIERILDPFGIEKWYLSASYTGDTSKYNEFYFKYGEPMSDGSGEVNWRDPYYLGSTFTEKQEVFFIDVNYEETYTFALFSYDEGPSGTINLDDGDGSEGEDMREVIFFEEQIDFSTIENSFVEQNEIVVHRYIYDGGNQYSIYANYLENLEYYSNFSIAIFTVDDQPSYVANVSLRGLKEPTEFSLGNYSETGKYKFVLSCTSTDPADIQKYIEEHPGSGVPTEVYEVEIFEQEIDFSKIDEYLEPDPAFYSVDFYRRISPHGSEVLLVDFDYKDSRKYWSDFEVNIVSEDERINVVSAAVDYDFPGYKDEQLYLPEIEKETIDQLVTQDFSYTITCQSTDPSSPASQDGVEVFSGEVAANSLEAIYFPGSVEIKFEKDGDNSVMTATIHGLDTEHYTYENSKIVISSEGQTLYEEAIEDVTAKHVCLCYIDDGNTYNISFETMLNGRETILFQEDIDFSQIDGGGQQTVLPNVVNVGIYLKGTYFYGPRMFVDIGFDGEQYNPTDFSLSILSPSTSDPLITSTIDAFEDADSHILGYYLGDVEEYSEYLADSFNYQLLYQDNIVYESSFDLSSEQVRYFEFCPNIYRGQSATSVSYELQLYFEDANIYNDYSFTIIFEPVDGGDEIVVPLQDKYSSQVLTEISDYSITYKVSVYKYETQTQGESEFVYSEIIDFANI